MLVKSIKLWITDSKVGCFPRGLSSRSLFCIDLTTTICVGNLSTGHKRAGSYILAFILFLFFLHSYYFKLLTYANSTWCFILFDKHTHVKKKKKKLLLKKQKEKKKAMLFFLVCHKGLTIINNKNKNNKMYIWFLYASFLTRLRFFFFKLLLCFQKFFFFTHLLFNPSSWIVESYFIFTYVYILFLYSGWVWSQCVAFFLQQQKKNSF